MVLLSVVNWDKYEGERSMMGLKGSVLQIGSIFILDQLQVWNAKAYLMVYEWDRR